MLSPALTRDSAPPGVEPAPGHRWRGRTVVSLLVAVVVSTPAWLLFLGVPLTSDEAGFPLLGRHWSPGHSLYGNYWVDRPPLLIWVFSWVAHLGAPDHSAAGVTAPALKLLGAETKGELLAVPLVLLGLVCLIGALRQGPGPRAIAPAAVAGAAAMAAALVKQNVVDVFVYATVPGSSAVAAPLRWGAGSRRSASRRRR